ncbi:MAG: DEAD/DEAH box helicase [Nanoarchaeota archaeon]|nr:DEAD/DEAH box helicase [Nanoarchaeota archaeon]
MYKITNFLPRRYQENIFISAKEKNSLICLPTGTGKTKLAIMMTVYRLNKNPESNIVIISPTKPLSSQIANEIRHSTDIPTEKISLLTGAINSEERSVVFKTSKVIVATPQTIQFDLQNDRISFENTSLLVVDECHRSKEKFANTIVAENYMKNAKDKLILALTASPGATKEKISEVCSNLFIENIELRTEEDVDIAEHIQKKESIDIRLPLPKDFQLIQNILKSYYITKASGLKRYGITKPKSLINKTDLLLYQKNFQTRIRKGDFSAYRAISEIAEMIKISHAQGLIETQTPKSLMDYFQKLKSEKSKAAKNILKNKSIENAISLTKGIIDKNQLHPKLEELKKIISKELKDNPNTKTIIFANYRSTVEEIKKELSKIQGAIPVKLIGQSGGLSQKNQLVAIDKFNRNAFNIIVCTSIGEEGISIGSLDLAVFYDHTASEIRKIQRSGRVARIKPGKIINLIAEKTLDEAMLWTAKRKETKMHNLLGYMKKNLEDEDNC